MSGNTSNLAVGAIVRRGTDILLVSEPGDDDEPVWALPGGMVSAGETLLQRVGEDTGLVSMRAERLVWVARYAVGGEDFEALGFEAIGDGDGDGGGREWMPVQEAVARLSRMWFAPIREPAVAYLTGRAAVATLWQWARLDGPPETVPPLGS